MDKQSIANIWQWIIVQVDIEKETINLQKTLFKIGILDFSNNCTLKKTPNLERLLRPQIPRMYIHFRLILFVHKAKFLIVHNIIFIFFWQAKSSCSVVPLTSLQSARQKIMKMMLVKVIYREKIGFIVLRIQKFASKNPLI